MTNDNFDLPRPTDPVPSATSAVINDDGKVYDYVVNGDGTVVTRTGKVLPTLTELNKNYVNRVIGSFGDAGLVVENGVQVVTDTANGGEWKPSSASYPVSVPSVNPMNSSWYQVSYNSHTQLANRDSADSHPATAISRGASNVDADITSLEAVSLDNSEAIEELKNESVKVCSQYASVLASGNVFSIDCYGDSTMWGATVGDLANKDPNNPPESLSVAINLLYGLSISPSNLAISGSSLRGMISGTDGSGSTFESKLMPSGVSENTNVIYCNHGINDSQLDLDIIQYRADLYEFVSLCRKYAKTPVLVTPNPNPILLIIDEGKSKRLKNYVEVMRSVAQQLSVDIVDQFYYFSKTADQVGINVIVPDGAHLSSPAYRQAGFNLAIPITSAGNIGKTGDLVGLNQSSWFDNANINRVIQQQPTVDGTRCGATLSFDRDPLFVKGLNYPVILDNPQECVSLIGLQWPSGGKVNVSVNNYGIMYPFSLEKAFGDTSFLNWNAETKIRRQMWAGLNIFSFLFDIATPSASPGFAFSGLFIPKLKFSGMTNASSSLEQDSIGFYDTISLKFNFDSSSSFVLTDKSGSNVLSVSKDSGIFTSKLYANNVVVQTDVLSPSSQPDGEYPMSITVKPLSIDIVIEGIAFSVSITTPLPELKIGSGWVSYHVEPSQEF